MLLAERVVRLAQWGLGTMSSGQMSLETRLRAIARFLPVFESDGFEFGHWVKSYKNSAGVLMMGYYELSDEAEGFHEAAATHGWVIPFDWRSWAEGQEFERLRTDPAYLASADPEQLVRLLTTYFRAERFSDGTLEAAYDAGVLTGILRRAQALLEELRGNGSSDS